MDLNGAKNVYCSVLLDFVKAFCAIQPIQPRQFTIIFTEATLTGKDEEVEFFRFLQALREVPEFQFVRFEVYNPILVIKEKEKEQILQRACKIRNVLLLGRKRKFEQL